MEQSNQQEPLEPARPANDDESRFTFVLQPDQRGVRSHAMREYWRKRHEKSKKEKAAPKNRPLLSKSSQSGNQTAHPPASHLPAPAAVGDGQHGPIPLLPSPSRLYPYELPLDSPGEIGLGMTVVGGTSGPPSPSPGVPTQVLTGIDHALANSRLDPFEMFPVDLTAQHHKLLHHWLSTHATMMFERIPTFNPMRDVWFPLDLSNAASFNAIMAHSAAHLAWLYGIKASKEALMYKNEAVRIIAIWMNDGSSSIGDDIIAAVLRLLTYERYWGNEMEWRVHRDGLMRMIEARGGITGLDGNWRLELVAFLVSLMAKPSWFDSSNQLWELSQMSRNHGTPNGQNLQRVRGLWLISFIQDMRTLRSSASKLREYALPSYTAIQDALELLKVDSQRDAPPLSSPEASCTDHELARISSLLLISVILHGTLATRDVSPSLAPCSLSGLDRYLQDRRLEWQDSVEGLHGLLFFDLMASPDSAQTTNYIQQMAHVLGSLSSEARRGVERCLVYILHPIDDIGEKLDLDESWTPDLLLSSVHGL